MKRRGRLRFSGPKQIRTVDRALDLLRRLGHSADSIELTRNDYMVQIRRHDKRAKLHNSVADLKEIQSNFDKLETSLNKEMTRLAANPTEVKSWQICEIFKVRQMLEQILSETGWSTWWVDRGGSMRERESCELILSVGLKGKMYEDITPVEASYKKLCEQLYTKRFKIVNGVVPVKLRIIHEAMRCSFEDILKNEAMRSAFEETIENKGVPKFWLTVMKAKPVLCKEINGLDEDVLEYLKDIKLCKVDSPKRLKFEFEFAENPFFKNQLLTKTYHMVDEDYMMPIDGTNIEWSGGKCSSEPVLVPSERSVSCSRVAVALQYGDKCSSEPVLVPSERSESCSRVAVGYESFFDFFYHPVNYEDAEHRQIWMQHDYEIRCALQDIIHNAISYFLEKTLDFPIAEKKLPYETYQNGGLDDGADDDESLYEFDCQLSDNGKVEIEEAESTKASLAALVPRPVDYDSYVGGLGGFPRDEGFGPYSGGSGYGYGSDSGAAAGYGSGRLYGRGGGYGGGSSASASAGAGSGAGAGRYHPYAR